MLAGTQIVLAPEIKGSKCPDCGSTLERLTAGRWCDFCCDLKGDKVHLESLLEELDALTLEGSLARSEVARDLLNDALAESYNNGYDDGQDNCDYDCGDEW